jgi:hypothetical protein
VIVLHLQYRTGIKDNACSVLGHGCCLKADIHSGGILFGSLLLRCPLGFVFYTIYISMLLLPYLHVLLCWRLKLNAIIKLC